MHHQLLMYLLLQSLAHFGKATLTQLTFALAELSYDLAPTKSNLLL